VVADVFVIGGAATRDVDDLRSLAALVDVHTVDDALGPVLVMAVTAVHAAHP
jgi:hypothetical protein